ncbi:hypothetical protein [Nocardia sp. NPDC004860]|uniref:hypothetical protein n=1 Tax=Nocardia sp. NPDC004860 TaxID=3154557 RepID=UPI00339DAA7E
MHAAHRPVRHIAWGATTLALAATIAALSAPTGTASIDGPEVDDCSTGTCTEPSSYVVGQTYSFYAGPFLTNVSSTSFYDNGKCIGSISYPHTGRNAIAWVPTTAGTHELSVATTSTIPFVVMQPYTFTVSVVAAPPGSGTPQPPQQGTCTGSGSANLLGSGSANLLGSGS